MSCNKMRGRAVSTPRTFKWFQEDRSGDLWIQLVLRTHNSGVQGFHSVVARRRLRRGEVLGGTRRQRQHATDARSESHNFLKISSIVLAYSQFSGEFLF